MKEMKAKVVGLPLGQFGRSCETNHLRYFLNNLKILMSQHCLQKLRAGRTDLLA